MAGSTITIKILADASKAQRGFDDAATAAQRWEKSTERAGRAAAVALAAVAAAGLVALKAAATQEQAFGALSAVFKDGAPAMQEWATQQAKIGLSSTQAAESAAYLGSMLKGAGYSLDAAAEQSRTLVQLGADMAATFGGTTADAVQALAATMRGEYDPIERFGVSIKQSDVSARLAAQGMSGLTGDSLKLAEAQARVALIMERTRDAQGQSAREAETASAVYQRIVATIKNLAAAFGQALLPAAVAVGDALGATLGFIEKYPGLVGAVVVGFTTLAAAVAATHYGLKAYNILTAAAATWSTALETVLTRLATRYMTLAVATDSYTVAQLFNNTVLAAVRGYYETVAIGAMLAGDAVKKQTVQVWANNAAWLANPVVLIVAAILAAIAAIAVGLKLLYDNCESFRNLVDSVFSAVGDIIGQAVNIIRPALEELGAVFAGIFDDISQTVKTIVDDLRPTLEAFATQFGEMIRAIVEAVGPFVQENLPALKAALQSVGESIGKLMEVFGPMLQAFGPQIGAVLVVTIGLLLAFAQQVAAVLRLIAAQVSFAWEGIKNTIATIKTVLDSVGTAFNWLRERGAGAFGGLRDFVGGAVGTIRGLLDRLGSAASAVARPFDSMASNIRGAFDSVASKVRTVWEYVQSIAAKIADVVSKIPVVGSLGSGSVTPSGYGLGADSGGSVLAMPTVRTSAPVIVANSYRIEISGTVTDPDGAARAIEELLTRRGMRAGATPSTAGGW
jgi:hypothetical protein